MFVTQSLLEQSVPPGLAPPNCRYWRGVSLSLESPWYICVIDTNDKGAVETTLIAWESELLEVIGSKGGGMRLNAIGRMDKSRRAFGRWELKWIEALWETTIDERNEFGRLVFRFEGEAELWDELLHAVHPKDSRHLVFSTSANA